MWRVSIDDFVLIVFILSSNISLGEFFFSFFQILRSNCLRHGEYFSRRLRCRRFQSIGQSCLESRTIAREFLGSDIGELFLHGECESTTCSFFYFSLRGCDSINFDQLRMINSRSSDTTKKDELSVKIPQVDQLRSEGLRFDRLQPPEHELFQQDRLDFGKFVAREAILDEEYWVSNTVLDSEPIFFSRLTWFQFVIRQQRGYVQRVTGKIVPMKGQAKK